MIYLQTYKMFESMQDVTPEQRTLLNGSCLSYSKNNIVVPPTGAWWINSKTGLVDVGGSFVLKEGWTRGLLGIKFGRVSGSFDVTGAGLEDPSELPREIGKHLLAADNKFRTLEGIGKVRTTIDVDDNLLVSLEGMTRELLGGLPVGNNILRSGKFSGLSGNPVRGPFLRDDLEEVLSGKTSWTSVYLSIVSGEYAMKKDNDESIEWIIRNKLTPELLGAEIKRSPEKMAVEIAKVPENVRVRLDKILDQIDLPPGFRDDKDLVSSLSDVGL